MLNLLWGLAAVFFVLWVVGFAAFHVASGLIHILLVLALAMVLVRVFTGHRMA